MILSRITIRDSMINSMHYINVLNTSTVRYYSGHVLFRKINDEIDNINVFGGCTGNINYEMKIHPNVSIARTAV